MTAKFHKIHDDAVVPVYATRQSAGADLCAYGSHSIYPHQWDIIPTGLRAEIAPGYEIQIRPRSGLAMLHSVTVLNAPGTIDADYDGEICVILINHGSEPFYIKHGDRIAQAVLARVERIEGCDVSDNERGTGGFRSTGKGEVK
jgi:dUTP pyrophosphatase